MSRDHQPNPNTPENWNERWKAIALAQTKDPLVQQRLAAVANLVPPQATVLDLAAGAGLIRHGLHHPASYTPVDFSPEALKLCDVPGIQADCTKVPVPDDSYDTVLALEILEHLDHPRLVLNEAIRIASLQVIVTVPNNRLPPAQFAYHRRTWDLHQLSFFLHTFPEIIIAEFLTLSANIIANCFLRREEPSR